LGFDRTPSGVQLEYTWSLEGLFASAHGCHLERGPHGLQVDSTKSAGKLQILYLEFTWTSDGVYQDV